MATLLSSPTTMTISRPGPSALATLAQSMSAGTWAQLSVGNQNAMLGVGSISGSMIHFSNRMPWNPKAQAIEVLAMDHNYGRLRYVRYTAVNNQFVLMADDVGLGSSTQHGYDHVTVNPTTGDLYFRLFTAGAGAPIQCVRKPFASPSSFSALPTVNASFYLQVAVGTCWWSGSFSGGGGHGAQGSLMVFNSGSAQSAASDGQICAYDPVRSNWFFNRTGMAPNYGSGATYHSVMQYSAVRNVAVYGGGNAAPNKLWRLNADGSFNAMPAVPSGKAVGIQAGNLVADPVSGNFLLLSAGQLWELNPTGSGSWTQLTGSRTPPGGVGRPGPGSPEGVVSSAIPELGVIVYITQSSPSGGTFFLYKHA